MRHFRIFRPSFGLMLRMLAGVAACAVSSSCTDDTFDKHGQQGASGMLAFDVAAPGSWTDGSASTRAADNDISIRKITQTGGGKPLYLVTEIAEAAVNTAASNAITRGTTTTEDTFKDHSFGLSAICYTGEWPGKEETNEWTTNFAHNLEVKCDASGTWKSEKQLYWIGSENIKFFAYSPYSATSDSSENDAADATPSVIHSTADAKGVPTLTYTVPADVTKQIDLMYATADCGGNGTGNAVNGAVQLKFEHALTAVTIKTGKKMLAGKVTKITISGVHGKGDYQIGAEKWEVATDEAKRTFSIDKETTLDAEKDSIMTGPGTVLNEDKDGYTFMMIPQELSEEATLTISFTDSLTKTPRTLQAKLQAFTQDKEWKIGKQYTYSINSTGIVINPVIALTVNRKNTLYPNGGYKGIWSAGNPHPNVDSLYTAMGQEEKDAYLPVSGILNDVNINAYMKVIQAHAESDAAKEQTRKLNFMIEWSTDDGKTWNSSKDHPELGWKQTTGSQSRADDTDPMKPLSGSIILPAQSQFTYMRNFLYGKGTTIEGQTPDKTITDAGNGSKDAPHDLVANNDVAQESANCYIVNDHGYYKFPAYYGNTYNKANDTSSYMYNEKDNILAEYENLVLKKFVGHDNLPISNGAISGVTDAILLWQDSPDLVTEVKFENDWVSFRVPEETINQGNAVIAVRNSKGTILWSWHIWVTHREWNNSTCNTMSNQNLNEKGQRFIIAPCNLGYCEPHKGDDARNILIRFVANSEQVGDNEIVLTVSGAPQPGKDEKGIIKFTQPEIAASEAGDNTYYQWGRKDPMLPGIQNKDTRTAASDELDMVNKMFYSTDKYRFYSDESARSIGESIEYPHRFFMHKRPQTDGDKPGDPPSDIPENHKRRHWHDGTSDGYSGQATPYNLKSIMNYWNIQLIKSGNANFNTVNTNITSYKENPNDKYVIKTIYDPSPAGFKVPPIKAYADFFDNALPNDKLPSTKNAIEATSFKGWTVTLDGTTFYFPATGVRNMGVKTREVTYGTFPAFSSITYIATSGFHKSSDIGSSCLILAIDKRSKIATSNTTYPIDGTNNAYGFTVRPIRDGQTGD